MFLSQWCQILTFLPYLLSKCSLTKCFVCVKMRGNPFCDNFIFSGAPIKLFFKIKIKWVWFKINALGALSDFWGLQKKRKLTPIIVVFKCLFNFHTFTFAILYFEIIYWINIGNCPPLNCSCTVLFTCFYLNFFSTNILDFNVLSWEIKTPIFS